MGSENDERAAFQMADNSGIKLFEHNEAAYISAVRILKETGKAAVIYPTGTGKSFIAFKLCENNADKKICRLPPGKYIFRMQCENLAVTGFAVQYNIAFLLMQSIYRKRRQIHSFFAWALTV